MIEISLQQFDMVCARCKQGTLESAQDGPSRMTYGKKQYKEAKSLEKFMTKMSYAGALLR